MDLEGKVATKVRQVRSMLGKAETLAQRIETKCEEREDCYQEMEELTKRLRKLRAMLQKIGQMKSGIRDKDMVDSIKLLITRYDQCVRAVDLAIMHSAVRGEQKRSARSTYSENSAFLGGEMKTLKVGGQEITVQNSKEIEVAVARSKRLESLRKDVGEVLEVFQEVEELVKHDRQSVDSLHNHISEAKESAKQSEKELSKAVRFNQTALGWGIAGAAVGAIFGGPVGLAIGSKAGAALGLAVGGTTGTLSALKIRRGIRKAHAEVSEESENNFELQPAIPKGRRT
mmetsp:Transcript_33744/g.81766  ORF Transcript_33744/g.81766 Transcript_33744/m.81766 type:complete len:286 (-) Transcript_33744:338-1195(-)|eukprot:CAMPEP_0114511214 /NCGR_PEP_ID=MMETSP0109-20121206/14228_1 /TAXON_ID=29199 /ORGANISM="Chlorarachnion reptans, Strain CCCM449" /LENGTH=285 /DNA_ID=CAMNT_0001690627 /DNA_START=201 /DNA_END=1058 /DNA_ORIENTATION=-